jgi:hypothetical protein
MRWPSVFPSAFDHQVRPCRPIGRDWDDGLRVNTELVIETPFPLKAPPGK